jgi:phage-related protein
VVSQEKLVVWIGSTLDDLKDLPEEVQDDIGYVLGGVQQGEFDSSIKPLKGFSGVYEIRTDFDTDTYQAVYVLNLADVIYV